jgi:hypothetical protein
LWSRRGRKRPSEEPELTKKSQAAVSAAAHGAEYILYYSGVEMIVHRLVPCPHPEGHSGRYYIEPSDRILVSGSDTPVTPALMATLLTALHLAPDLPTLPVKVSPTPYTADSPGDKSFKPPLATLSSMRGGRAQSPDFPRRPIVHFDVEGLKKDITFSVDVLATPSSPLESLPSLNGLYWEHALSSDPISDNDFLSSLLHRSWYPWRCLFSQQGMKPEDESRAVELWMEYWVRWRSARRALGDQILVAAPTTHPHLTSAQHSAIVASRLPSISPNAYPTDPWA